MATRAPAAVLLAALLSIALQSKPPAPAAARWIVAARDHQPGTIDEPLLEVSGWRQGQFVLVRRNLDQALSELKLNPAERADVVSRGVLLHTDIAILTPQRAASFTELSGPLLPAHDPRVRGSATSVIVGSDGQFLDSMAVTAHWLFARILVRDVSAEPSRDWFVRDWYRAIAARFMGSYAFGMADPHLEEARKILPQDPWILFYSGALHDAYASSRAQNIIRSSPKAFAAARPVRAPRPELETAAGYFRRAIRADGAFAEAHLRLGRALGLLGEHREAADELQAAERLADSLSVRYYAALFLGTELGAVGQQEQARAAFARAAALVPQAQSPWIGLSALARRMGDRKGALDALRRLSELEAGARDGADPWWTYYRSYATDADEQLRAVRARFQTGAVR